MTLSWTDHAPKRPNRYSDWEHLNRSPSEGNDLWCPASLFVRPANLGTLKQRVEDHDGLRLSADEMQRLDSAIANPPAGDLNVYAYIRESIAFDEDGAYADGDTYRIGFVGAPIPTLKFRPGMQMDRTTPPPVDLPQAGVAVGVIDVGIAFAHERFRKADGLTTRFGAIWLQEPETATPDNGVAFGTRLDAAAINRLIADAGGDEQEVYRQTGQLDFSSHDTVPLARRTAHGTHVLDLAAGGNGDDDGPLIFAVQLPSALTAETSAIAMSSYILQAFRQILLWADQVGSELPLVINFSFGNYAGPKDGFGLVEREISRLVAERNNAGGPTVAVLPSGNTYRARNTARMNLTRSGNAGASSTVEWLLRPDDHTPNFLEIWLPEGSAAEGESPVALELETPFGTSGPTQMPSAGRAAVLQSDGRPVAAVYFSLDERNGGPTRPYILIATNPTATFENHLATAPFGPWRITLTNRTRTAVPARLYVERDDTPYLHYPKGRQSILNHPAALSRDPETGSYDRLGPGPVTHEGTLSGIGNGPNTILVGAGQGSRPGIVPARYTSSGATETKAGPDLAFVADLTGVARGIYAAGTMSGTRVRLSGTSVAAPQATRMIAARLAADRAANGGTLGAVDLQALLEALANRDDAGPVTANDRPRLGRIAFDRVTESFEDLPPRGYPQAEEDPPVA